MAVLYLFALYLAIARGRLNQEKMRQHIRALLDLPTKTERVLEGASQCEALADKYHKVEDFLFLGRAVHYPIAMDGALKLKEVSYVHAEGYPTGETKHGPNALIDENLPVVTLAACDPSDHGSRLCYGKTLCNIRGVKNQGGRVIAVDYEGYTAIYSLSYHANYVS